MATQSRLHRRKTQYTINVIQRTRSNAVHTESNLYTGLTATRNVIDAKEIMTDAGAIVTVNNEFWFNPIDGVLPAIEEKHVLSIGGVRYEVMMVNSLDYMSRLQVQTRRLR